MRAFVVMAALALLALPIFALGAFGQCRTVGSQFVYQQQTYATPYVSNYQLVYPQAVQTFLIPNQFYSVEPDLAAARIQQQIADDAAERALAKMLQFLRQQQLSQPAPGGSIPQVAGPHEHPSSLSTKVQAVVNAKCVACHHDAANKIDLRDVTKLTDVQALKMVSRTTLNPGDPGFMPKPKGGIKGEALPEQEYADLAHWAYEVSSKGSPPIPKATPDVKSVPDVKELPKPPPAPMPPADKAKSKDKSDEDEVSAVDTDDEDSGPLAARKKKPKPRPRPRPPIG